MEKLKPCPFCGGKARFGKTFVMQFEERQIIYCGKCWARTAGFDTQEEAADFWNTRVERSAKRMRLTDTDALVKQLSDKAKEMHGIAEQCQGQAINYYEGAKYGFAKAAIIANGLPTIDAAPVVRCKDCKYYLAGSDGLKYCYKHDDDILWHDDDFCSKAERSEEI